MPDGVEEDEDPLPLAPDVRSIRPTTVIVLPMPRLFDHFRASPPKLQISMRLSRGDLLLTMGDRERAGALGHRPGVRRGAGHASLQRYTPTPPRDEDGDATDPRQALRSASRSACSSRSATPTSDAQRRI